MSILIKGMEMPESCYYCPFTIGDWGYSPPHKIKCIINGEEMPIDERNVQHNHINCPLAPVPPHGRLIDADALKQKKKHSNEFAENVVSVAEIDWLPTIIEGES